MNLTLDGINNANLAAIIRVFEAHAHAVASERPYMMAFLEELRQALADELELRELCQARSEGIQTLDLPALSELRLFERKALEEMFVEWSLDFEGTNQAVSDFYADLALGLVEMV